MTGDLPDAELDRLESETRKYPDDPLLKAGATSVDLGDSPEQLSGDADESTEDQHALRRRTL